MATCGYLCPICEGKGFKDDGSECTWCKDESVVKNENVEDWIKKVHEGPCCSDSDNQKTEE